MKDARLDLILREVGNAVSAHLLPEASSAVAKDTATFGAGLLRGLLLDRLTQPHLAAYGAALREVMAGPVGDEISRDAIGTWVEGLYVNADSASEQHASRLAAIARSEKHLQASIRTAEEAEKERAQTATASAAEIVNPDSVAEYLNRRLERRDIVVAELRTIPGGGSKVTRAISLKPVPGLPDALIMRQDYAVNHVGNSIISEYPVLSVLHDAGLPVAAPVLLEGEQSALGAPFMLVEKVEGRNIGNLWEFFPGSDPRPVCLDLARLLARIHSLRGDRFLSKKAGSSLRDNVLQQIAEIHGKWKAGRSSTSPVIALGLLWLKENLETTGVAPALVHGDCAFTNILVHDGRINALLDWEFAHVGDPAEDLAYIRDIVGQAMPWQEFIDAYCAAGGAAPSPARLDYFDIWRALRNAVYASLAGESFMRGDNRYLMLGWAGVYAEPLLEYQIMQMIGSTWDAKV